MAKRSLMAALAAFACVMGGPAHAAPPEPPPVEAYARLPAMDMVTLSPSGGRLAFVAFDGQGRKLFVRDLAGAPLAVMDLGASKVRAVGWGGERFVLIQVSRASRLSMHLNVSEQSTVFILDVQTGKIGQVFSKGIKTWDVVRAGHGLAEVDGRWVGYFSTLEQTRTNTGDMDFTDYNPDLYQVDLETGDLTMLNRGDDHTEDWLVRDGKVVARLNYEDITGAWSLTAGESGRVLAQGKAPLGDVALSGFGRDRSKALVIATDSRGRRVLNEISLADGAVTLAGDDGVDAAGALHDRRNNTLIGYYPESPEPRIVLFDPSAQAKAAKALRAFTGKRPVIVSASADHDRMILHTDGGDDSGSWWLVDLKAGKADPLGLSYPRITPAKVGETRAFQYRAGDGLDLDGILTLPPGREARNLPVIVLPHGGPEAHDRLGFDWMAQAFASRGYAVVQPNFRGSTGRGLAFRDKGFGQWGRLMQSDVSDALAFLAAQGVVDPSRACIVGASYGGYVAVAGTTLQQGLYRCSIAFAGVFDLAGMLADTRARTPGMRYWKAFMGDNPTAISPTSHAGRADAPILLIHGKDDAVVPFDQSSTMAAALRRAGKPVELLSLDGGDHWLTDEASRTAMLKAALAFLEKHNPPD
ncbi:MAG TPA: S9 family peptidase [Caulobacter sp.]|nr:S9 family peptidase [Caulobacter sp.]